MNKEFIKPQLQTPVRLQPHRQCQKFYLLAKKFGKRQLEINRAVEWNYHIVVKAIKKLYATLPNQADRTVFEMNRKFDKISVDGMHDFLTRSFYFNLECDIWGKYAVHYAFGNCPFRHEIEKLIYDNHLSAYIVPKENLNVEQFHKDVLACQPLEFISVLTP